MPDVEQAPCIFFPTPMPWTRRTPPAEVEVLEPRSRKLALAEAHEEEQLQGDAVAELLLGVDDRCPPVARKSRSSRSACFWIVVTSGMLIREARLLAGVSQDELGARVGKDRA